MSIYVIVFKVKHRQRNTDKGDISMSGHRQELVHAGAMHDPSRLGGNVLNPIILDPTTLGEIRAAFEHQTAGVYILHTTPEGESASRDFASMSLGLLAEVARVRPDLVDDGANQSYGFFPMIAHRVNGAAEEVGVRGGAISFSRDTADGFSEATPVEIAACKVTFLESAAVRAAQAAASAYRRTDRYGHKVEPTSWFRNIADQTLKALENAAAESPVEIDPESRLGLKVADVLHRQSSEVSAAQARRAEILRGTVLDPEAHLEGLHTVEVRAGGTVRINLDGDALLTPRDRFGFNHGQTAEAFFARRGGSDTGGRNIDGFTGKTVAIMEIDGHRYVVVDDRRDYEYGQAGILAKNGAYRNPDKRDRGQVRILEILGDGREDPRYGVEVDEAYYDFHASWRRGPQEVYARSEPYREPTGVTVELDKRGQLVVATDKPINVIGMGGTLTPERDAQPLSRAEVLQHQADEVRRRMDSLVRHGGKSGFTWPQSLIGGLDRILETDASGEGRREDGWISIGAGNFRNPENWQNDRGQMDNLNAFLGKMGAGNRDYLLARIRQEASRYRYEPEAAQNWQNGYVDFATGIDGVVLRVNYAYGDYGIDSISLTLWLNPDKQMGA